MFHENLLFENNIINFKRIKTLKLPYWTLNNLGDERFRDSLGLK